MKFTAIIFCVLIIAGCTEAEAKALRQELKLQIRALIAALKQVVLVTIAIAM